MCYLMCIVPFPRKRALNIILLSRWSGLAGLLLLLAACTSSDMVAKFTNPQEQAVAKRYFGRPARQAL